MSVRSTAERSSGRSQIGKRRNQVTTRFSILLPLKATSFWLGMRGCHRHVNARRPEGASSSRFVGGRRQVEATDGHKRMGNAAGPARSLHDVVAVATASPPVLGLLSAVPRESPPRCSPGLGVRITPSAVVRRCSSPAHRGIISRIQFAVTAGTDARHLDSSRRR